MTVQSRRDSGEPSPQLAPVIGSILLASADPDRLRIWYEQAFGVTPDTDGFMRFGDLDVLINGRDDVSATNPEPGRMIINIHVDSAVAKAKHLNTFGVSWLAEVEYREPDGAWFGTLLDPDGNYVQIIELTDAYWQGRQLRNLRHGGTGLRLRISSGPGASTLRNWGSSPPRLGQVVCTTSVPAETSRCSSRKCGPRATRRWPGKSTTSWRWSPRCETEV